MFLREVDDALREDQVFDALRRYGKPVGALVVAGLVGLAGWLWYDYHKATVAGEQGERMTIALDQLEAGRVQTSSDSMAPLVKDGGPGYRAAAQLTQAGIAAQQNKTDDAAKLLAAVAADQSAPQSTYTRVQVLFTTTDRGMLDALAAALDDDASNGTAQAEAVSYTHLTLPTKA